MARRSFCGFESKDTASGASGVEGWFTNAPVETALARLSLGVCAKLDSGALNQAKTVGTGSQATGGPAAPQAVTQASPGTAVAYVRGYFYFAGLPGTTTTILRPAFTAAWTVPTLKTCSVRMDSTGHLIAQSGSNSSSASSVALNTGQWYRIECQCTITTTVAAITGTINAVRLDGTDLSLTATYSENVSGGTISMSPTLGWITAPGANTVCYVDDVAWNDDQGANQNSWPGDGKVMLLVPISTNAAAAKWLDNDGTQTNMWDGADNTPPVGVAAATTPSHAYIKHTGGAAGTTDAFDANMTSYQTVGVTNGSIINCLYFMDVDGEESGTGTKLLNFEVLSNPVMASPGNVTAGDNAGAQGIYTFNWAFHFSAMTYSPTVILATSPVMRARRPETASRVASVCFMGMWVDFTPAAISLLKPMRAAVLGV